jgi:hypothetical protein
MALVGCPLQLDEEAESLNGEVRGEPLFGVLTLGSPEDVEVEEAELEELTVTATSLTHTAPLVPHAFT